MDSAVYLRMASAITVASYPGRIEGEKQPGIDCLRMRDNSQQNLGIRLRLETVGKSIRIRPIYSVRIIERCSRLPFQLHEK